MFARDAPAPSQRCHWCWNEVGLFVQVPFCAVSVSPTFVVPVIDGKLELVGGAAAAVAAQTNDDTSRDRQGRKDAPRSHKNLSWITIFKRESKGPG